MTGDRKGSFSGTMKQNIAFLNRCNFIRMGYMSEAQEVAMVHNATKYQAKKEGVPPLGKANVRLLIKVASQIRDQFVGSDAPATDPRAKRVELAFSLRSTAMWARYTTMYAAALPDTNPNAATTAALKGLDMVITNATPHDVRTGLHALVKTELGWDDTAGP
jgi:hypothetical protein